MKIDSKDRSKIVAPVIPTGHYRTMVAINDDYRSMGWKDIVALDRVIVERLLRVEMRIFNIEMNAIKEMDADILPDPKLSKIRQDAEERLIFAEHLIRRLGYDPINI